MLRPRSRRRYRQLVPWALALAVVLAPQGLLAADKRVALVIGIAGYQSTAPLLNPKNDAQDMAAALESLGFRVLLGLDLDKAALDRKIAEFAEALSGADVGVLFYGGHGLQVGGQNYLVPVDARLLTARSLDFETVRLDLVQRTMEREAKTNIIFLDACRDNPLSRNLARALGTRSSDVPRGLAAVESGIGTLISFSTQPGSVALDGDGRNSPFAGALAKHIVAAGSITDMLMNVRNDVVTATNNKQVPWEHSALRAKFYFKAPAAEPVAKPATAATTGPSFEEQAELELWTSVEDSNNPALIQSFLDQFPNGRFGRTARIMLDHLKQGQEQSAEAARQQSEAQKAEEEKKAALEQETEAKRKADEAKREAEYKAALAEARRSREAAEEAERRRAEAENAAKVAEAAAEEARKAAAAAHKREQVASRSESTVNVAAAPDTSGDTVEARAGGDALASSVQDELKRVGCYAGTVDGKWGPSSRAALDLFETQAKVSFSSREPSYEALGILAAQKGQVCSTPAPAATEASAPAEKEPKTEQAPSRKRQKSATSKSSGSRAKNRDCNPIVGPYGVYENPWCKN